MLTAKVKFWVNIITFLALALLIAVSWSTIVEAFGKLSDLSLGLLLLQFPVQLLSYNAVAMMYYSYFKNTGHLGKLQIKDMYKISLELNFINSVFPSGGVSGFSYLSLRLRPYGVSVATSTLAQMIRFLLTFVSFLIVLGIGLVFLAAGNQANGLVILIGSSVFFMIVSGVLLAGFIISDEQRIKSFVAFLPKLINFVGRRLHSAKADLIDLKRVERGLEELHQRYVELRKDVGKLKAPFVYALATNVLELSTIYLVYVAFGEPVNPGAVILAYAVANFAGLVAILPGGVGVYEGLMASVLTASGVERGLAISATLVYRVINLLIFVPIGFVLYQAALNKRQISAPFQSGARAQSKGDS